MRSTRNLVAAVGLVVCAALVAAGPADGLAQPASQDAVVLGVKVRFGGRYDDVRMCVATDAGVKGGIAADVSFFLDLGMTEDWTAHVDIPVMRPILFAAAFRMLQLEPSVSFQRRLRTDGAVDFVVGPTLGFSLHYGPDFESEPSGTGRRPSFFALGPTVGGYMGLDFKRPGESFNFQLGLTPYVTPLFSVGDPENHRGWVVGGLLDGSFRWK